MFKPSRHSTAQDAHIGQKITRARTSIYYIENDIKILSNKKMFWEIYSVKRSHNKNKKSGLFRRHVVEALYKLALVQKKKILYT